MRSTRDFRSVRCHLHPIPFVSPSTQTYLMLYLVSLATRPIWWDRAPLKLTRLPISNRQPLYSADLVRSRPPLKPIRCRRPVSGNYPDSLQLAQTGLRLPINSPEISIISANYQFGKAQKALRRFGCDQSR